MPERISAHAENKGRSLRFIHPKLPSWHSVQRLYHDAYRTSQITNGALVKRFEAAAAERLGVKHCIAVSSCTSGLMLVMKAMQLKGEVIIPSFTFFATGMAALWAGLKPVYADCNPATWTLDPLDVAKRVTRRTCALVGVHMYGNPCDTESLSSIASMTHAKLIFDSAHAFGSNHFGKPVGGFGDAEVFSLSPTKLLVAGEGGLVSTNDATLAARIVAARNYGDLGAYDPDLQGLNARMSEFNAALALAGLDAVESKVERHNQIAANYTRMLGGVPGVAFQGVNPGDVCAYKDYSVLIDPDKFGKTRDQVAAALLQSGYETKKYFYPPLHQQRILGAHHSSEMPPLPITERVSGRVLSLPIYSKLPSKGAREICRIIRIQAQAHTVQ
ncbi:MAG TPA: DegT/DnrJ/EryC1/StrS family aminotransferase [Bryobacteraceae bacterium]|nr:DegT/DnrJ/EryC1/StrS family aminotransferase [Bryobacteraceae bacterium]